MELAEILIDKKVNVGAEATIQGIFVLEFEIGYFVQSKENLEDKSRAIMVEFPDLTKILLSTVPAYGGSKYSYCNDAVITGTISPSQNTDFPLAISAISELTLYVSGEEFVVVCPT